MQRERERGASTTMGVSSVQARPPDKQNHTTKSLVAVLSHHTNALQPLKNSQHLSSQKYKTKSPHKKPRPFVNRKKKKTNFPITSRPYYLYPNWVYQIFLLYCFFWSLWGQSFWHTSSHYLPALFQTTYVAQPWPEPDLWDMRWNLFWNIYLYFLGFRI